MSLSLVYLLLRQLLRMRRLHWSSTGGATPAGTAARLGRYACVVGGRGSRLRVRRRRLALATGEPVRPTSPSCSGHSCHRLGLWQRGWPDGTAPHEAGFRVGVYRAGSASKVVAQWAEQKYTTSSPTWRYAAAESRVTVMPHTGSTCEAACVAWPSCTGWACSSAGCAGAVAVAVAVAPGCTWGCAVSAPAGGRGAG